MKRMSTPAYCRHCDQHITRSRIDGAWEDEKGACGCGDAEHEPRPTITEAEAEKFADARVMRAISTDSRYVNAESAEAQAEAEEEIGAEIWADLERKYDIDWR